MLPTNSATASHEPARSTAEACPPDQVPDQGFTDLPSGSDDVSVATRLAVNCGVEYGIARGTSPTTFNPSGPISRAQTATMGMQKLDQVTDYSRPAAAPDAFDDDDGVHEDNINDAAAEGIIVGTGPRTFNPSGNVSRDQMSTIVLGQLETAGATLPAQPADDGFTDVDCDGVAPDNAHCEGISILHELGIFTGSGNNVFGSGSDLSRAQMMFVETRAVALLIEQGLMDSLFAPPSIDFPATPAGEQLVQLSLTGTGGARDISFDLGQAGRTVDVALFDCGFGGAGPAVIGDTFRDIDDSAPGLVDSDADDIGSTFNGNAFIVSTNGDPAGGTYVDGYTSATQNLSVRVNSLDTDCAFVTVFVDANGNDELDLTAFTPSTSAGRGYRVPTEEFGVAGPVVWHFGEALNGADMEDDVLYVNRGSRFWVDAFFDADEQGNLFNWGRTNDRYFLDCFDDPLEINQTDWEEFLTVGDNTSDDQASYNRNGPNQFENEDDYPLVPFGVSAEVGDFDANPADTAANDVRFTFNTTNPGADIDFYWIDQFTSAGAFTASFDSLSQANTVVVPDLAPATYLLRGYSESECGNDSEYTDPMSVTISAPPPGAVVGAPISTSAVAQDKDSSATLNIGDVLTVTFNEVMAAPTANDTIEVTDSDGTVAEIVNGLNATFTLGSQPNQIVVTMTAGPNITTVGTTVGVQYPAEITASSGNVDADEGLEWNVAGSPDTTF